MKKENEINVNIFQVETFRKLKESDQVIGTASAVGGRKYHLVITKKGFRKMIPKMSLKDFNNSKTLLIDPKTL